MALSRGARVGAYEIQDLLGAGGMGEVYRARDPRLGRDVAIKVLPHALMLDGDRCARFEREARVLASLSHPHIGAIYGVEDTDGVRALVLELVDGPTLADRIAGGPLPIAEAVHIARQIADALEAAHEKGIIHRDLKPANVKLTANGVVKVLDFGLAKAIAGHAAALDLSRSPTITVEGTREGVLLGTAAYMSPEQARGRDVDRRTDIWAFGCVLYEMLTGRRAFAGDTVSDTIAAILSKDPDWRALPTTTSGGVRRLLHRCLQKEPKQRLHDIADARLELEDSGAIDAEDRARRDQSARRWRVMAVAWTVAVALVAALATLAVTRRSRAASVPDWSTLQTVSTQLTNYGGTEADGAISPDGRSFVFVSDHGGTPDIWLRQISGGDPVRLTNDAAEESNLEYAPDGESIFFTLTDASGPGIWRIGALGGQPRKILSNARLPALSRDGRNIAYFRNEPGGLNVLTVSALDGSATRALTRDLRPGNAVRPAWSPDGRQLGYLQSALLGPANLYVVDVATGQSRQVTRAVRGTEGVQSFAWLPDNRHLAISWIPPFGLGITSDLAILDLRDGSMARLTMNVGGGFRTLGLSSDGSRLIATTLGIRRELWKVPFGPDPEANGRAAVRLLDSTHDPMWSFVSREGGTLLFNSPISGRNLWTMPLDGRAAPRQITAIPGNSVAHASLSPDGSRVAFASSATGNSDIWVQHVDGTNLRQLTNDVAADSWPIWSPDGRWIAFMAQQDQRQEAWRVSADGGPAEKIFDDALRGDWIRQPSGTGTWIVTSRGQQALKLVDVERQTVLWEDNRPGGGLSLPMFSPDGQLVSAPYVESRDRDAIWVFEAATGKPRIAVRFPMPFKIFFRASWVDAGKAFIVNRYEPVSHVVLFDRFWVK